MDRHRAWPAGMILSAALVLLASPAWAVITGVRPLREVLATEQLIFMAQVEKVDPDKPSAVLEVQEDFKGKAAFRRLPINLTGDSEAKKENHTPQLLKRLAPKLPL